MLRLSVIPEKVLYDEGISGVIAGFLATQDQLSMTQSRSSGNMYTPSRMLIPSSDRHVAAGLITRYPKRLEALAFHTIYQGSVLDDLAVRKACCNLMELRFMSNIVDPPPTSHGLLRALNDGVFQNLAKLKLFLEFGRGKNPCKTGATRLH